MPAEFPDTVPVPDGQLFQYVFRRMPGIESREPGLAHESLAAGGRYGPRDRAGAGTSRNSDDRENVAHNGRRGRNGQNSRRGGEPTLSSTLPPVRPTSPIRDGWQATEDHAPGAGLQDTLDDNVGFFADHRAAIFANHHRSVVEITDALPRGLSRLDDLDRQPLSGKVAGFERIGQVVEVDDINALDAGDLVEVEVVGDDAPAQLLGEFHEPLIDRHSPGFILLDFVQLDFDVRVRLQLAEDVEPAPAAIAAKLVV